MAGLVPRTLFGTEHPLCTQYCLEWPVHPFISGSKVMSEAVDNDNEDGWINKLPKPPFPESCKALNGTSTSCVA